MFSSKSVDEKKQRLDISILCEMKCTLCVLFVYVLLRKDRVCVFFLVIGNTHSFIYSFSIDQSIIESINQKKEKKDYLYLSTICQD